MIAQAIQTGEKMGLLASHFSQHGYVILRSMLEANLTTLLYAYAVQLVNTCKWTSDTQVSNSPAFYAEPRMEELLLSLLPRIEEASGLRLHPTYSYLRVYQRGAVLAKHIDRPACEVSVSLNLGYEAASPWPLWVEGPAGVCCVQMEAGDALLYRGAECFHWRDAFSGERAAQVLLHYVDQNGANAEWRFDKRRGLGVHRLSALSQL